MGPPVRLAEAAADSDPMLPPKKTPLTGLIMLVALGVAIYKRKAIVEWIDKHVEKFNNSM
mgnify:CR=1 FL=1